VSKAYKELWPRVGEWLKSRSLLQEGLLSQISEPKP
jgi:hypothetical protein